MVHPIIDAYLDVAKKVAFDARRIERVELTVNPFAVQLCNRPAPRNSTQALVSFQHWAAVSLIFKAAGLGREAATARITRNDGRKFEASVTHCRGSVGRPMTDADITEKTRGQLRTAYPDAAAERILAQAWRIEGYPRVGPFCMELATGMVQA